MNSLACFYTLVHKFPTDMGAIQVLCSNLFFGPPLPRPCLLPAQIGYARGQARAYSPSFSRFWWGKIDQSQVLWSVASCDANYKIESLLQKVDLRSTLRNTLPQLATQQVVRKCCPSRITWTLCSILKLVYCDSWSWQSFVSTWDVFNCLFLLDVRNEIQLLSRVFCYSWLVCLLGFWLRNTSPVKVGNPISDSIDSFSFFTLLDWKVWSNVASRSCLSNSRE